MSLFFTNLWVNLASPFSSVNAGKNWKHEAHFPIPWQNEKATLCQKNWKDIKAESGVGNQHNLRVSLVADRHKNSREVGCLRQIVPASMSLYEAILYVHDLDTESCILVKIPARCWRCVPRSRLSWMQSSWLTKLVSLTDSNSFSCSDFHSHQRSLILLK